MTRHAKRTDVNQKNIVNELRSYGFTVKVTSDIGKGFPDILIAKDRIGMGIEIKDVNKREELTDAEIEMRSWWDDMGMKYFVAETTMEILEQFEKLRDKKIKKHNPVK